MGGNIHGFQHFINSVLSNIPDLCVGELGPVILSKVLNRGSFQGTVFRNLKGPKNCPPKNRVFHSKNRTLPLIPTVSKTDARRTPTSPSSVQLVKRQFFGRGSFRGCLEAACNKLSPYGPKNHPPLNIRGVFLLDSTPPDTLPQSILPLWF